MENGMTDKDSQIIERLRKIAIFKRFADSEEAMRKIAGLIEIRSFQSNASIIEEGQPGHEMFILNQGIVRIEKNTLEKERYTVVKLSEGMNIFFGEQALIDEDVRSASVIAETDCECFVIKKADLDRLAKEEPRICVFVYKDIAKIISSRLRKSNQDTIVLFEALVQEIISGDTL